MTTPVSTEAATMPDARGDPVAFELVKNALFFLVNEEAERRLQAMNTTTIRPGEIARFVCSSAGGRSARA